MTVTIISHCADKYRAARLQFRYDQTRIIADFPLRSIIPDISQKTFCIDRKGKGLSFSPIIICHTASSTYFHRHFSQFTIHFSVIFFCVIFFHQRPVAIISGVFMVSHNLRNRHTSCGIIPGRPITERRLLMPLGSQHGTNIICKIYSAPFIIDQTSVIWSFQIQINKLRFEKKRTGTSCAGINISQIIFVFLLAVKVLGYPPRIGLKCIQP